MGRKGKQPAEPPAPPPPQFTGPFAGIQARIALMQRASQVAEEAEIVGLGGGAAPSKMSLMMSSLFGDEKKAVAELASVDGAIKKQLKGRPLPKTPDERKRLKEEQQAKAAAEAAKRQKEEEKAAAKAAKAAARNAKLQELKDRRAGATPSKQQAPGKGTVAISKAGVQETDEEGTKLNPLVAPTLVGVGVLAAALVASGSKQGSGRRARRLAFGGNDSPYTTPRNTPQKAVPDTPKTPEAQSSPGWLMITVQYVQVENLDLAKGKGAYVKVDLLMPYSLQKKRTATVTLTTSKKLVYEETFKLFVPATHHKREYKSELQIRLVKEGLSTASSCKCGIYLKAVMHHVPFENSFTMYKPDKETRGAVVAIKADWTPIGENEPIPDLIPPSVKSPKTPKSPKSPNK